MLSPTILAALLAACAPTIDPHTEAALIAVESGGDAWALHGNAPDQSYAPRTYQEAYLIGTRLLIASRAGVDVGLTQVNSRNFAAYGVTLRDMLDPCVNLKVGSAILAADYRREWAATSDVLSPTHAQTALRRALQDYNSGSPTAAPQYTAAIIRALDSRLVALTLATTSATAPPVQETLPPAPPARPSPPLRLTHVASPPTVLFRNVSNPTLRDVKIATPVKPASSHLPGAVRFRTESTS